LSLTQGSKQSFFEKKDQKTFIRLVRDSTDKSFLLLFFKKEGLALMIRTCRAGHDARAHVPNQYRRQTVMG